MNHFVTFGRNGPLGRSEGGVSGKILSSLQGLPSMQARVARGCTAIAKRSAVPPGLEVLPGSTPNVETLGYSPTSLREAGAGGWASPIVEFGATVQFSREFCARGEESPRQPFPAKLYKA